MKTTGIFYGSTTGTTEDIAGRIATRLGIGPSDVHTASELGSGLIASYEVLILGSSTWGDGELQDEWYDAIEVLKGADLSGKTVALFGCGDSSSYSDTFCDAMGIIFEAVKGRCTVIGQVSAEGYSFSSSKAVVDGKFVGLAIDEMNEDGKTDSRLDAWTESLKGYLA